jgi:hypothetical protein
MPLTDPHRPVIDRQWEKCDPIHLYSKRSCMRSIGMPRMSRIEAPLKLPDIEVRAVDLVIDTPHGPVINTQR